MGSLTHESVIRGRGGVNVYSDHWLVFHQRYREINMYLMKYWTGEGGRGERICVRIKLLLRCARSACFWGVGRVSSGRHVRF